jgi:hypothetical protein
MMKSKDRVTYYSVREVGKVFTEQHFNYLTQKEAEEAIAELIEIGDDEWELVRVEVTPV